MELTLIPQLKNDQCTISQLLINGVHECFVLEDTDRGLKQSMSLQEIEAKKVHGKTAIPAGRYEIEITFSTRFQKPLPHVKDVPGFDGIRIHPGNTAANTEGCLLPGTTVADDAISNSRVAFAALFEKISAAITDFEKVFITINR